MIEALGTDPDPSDRVRRVRKALDVKLQAINSLTAILTAAGHFDVKNAASKKLNLLIQEI